MPQVPLTWRSSLKDFSLQLVIGNKNYSTWSLRPWMLLHSFSIEFDEQLVSLNADGLTERLLQYSDTARVPVLIDEQTAIFDSLAICEYINEHYLLGQGWPNDVMQRALARAITAEMHSGFAALRNEMPMNIRASRVVSLSASALKDVQRIDAIFSRYAAKNENGDLRLFGEFSIADCFFAPVVLRFKTYLPELSSAAQDYCQSILEHASLQTWIQAAERETEIIDEDEAGVDR